MPTEQKGYEETGQLLASHGVKFKLDDVISSQLVTPAVDKQSSQNKIIITTYPHVNGVRKREVSQLIFSSSEECKKIHNAVQTAIKRPHPPHLLKKELNNKILLLVNPFSGQKRASQLWTKYGKAILATAGIEVDIYNTEHPQHATEIVKGMDIDNYDAILVNSGDGLMSEVLSGLLMRKDRERALKIPICHIPGGTSNALAAAALFASNEPYSTRDVFITECALLAVRPRFLPVRLFSVDTEYNGKKSMFLSACWGLIADIDIASERFRWAGLARLHIEAIIRILQLPRVAKYKGRISYIPVNDDECTKKTRLPHESDRNLFGEGHFDYPAISTSTGKEETKSRDYEQVSDALDSPLLEVPPLGKPLGKEWTVIEGEFVMVTITALSHIGSDLPFIPSAKLGEPILYITLIDWAVVKNRFEVADLFIRMNRGVHLSYPCLQIIPAKAVRVEPITKTGYFAVDGEPCQNGSAFQVVPLKQCATVVGRKQVPYNV